MDFNDENDINEIEEIVNIVPRQRRILPRPNWMGEMGESDFRQRFRLQKTDVIRLAERLEPLLRPRNQRSGTMTTIDKLLITLRFCASGIFQVINGDLSGIVQSTVSRTITKTLRAVASLAPDHIKMPQSTEAIRESKRRHFGMVSPHGIPNVIGFIDCTHVKIFSPGKAEAERFRNRKGYFSINVQAIGDSTLKVLDVVARWPGSAHDSFIFDMSKVKADLLQGVYGESLLLGDGGYACTHFMLTPLLNPRNEAETSYNEVQILMRNAIERIFGIIKRRFPSLSTGLQIQLETILVLIVAACVLHNIAVDNDDLGEGFEDIEEDDSSEVSFRENLGDISAQRLIGSATRQKIIDDYFTN